MTFSSCVFRFVLVPLGFVMPAFEGEINASRKDVKLIFASRYRRRTVGATL